MASITIPRSPITARFVIRKREILFKKVNIVIGEDIEEINGKIRGRYDDFLLSCYFNLRLFLLYVFLKEINLIYTRISLQLKLYYFSNLLYICSERKKRFHL